MKKGRSIVNLSIMPVLSPNAIAVIQISLQK